MVTDSLFAPYIDEKYRKFALSLSPSDKLPRIGIRIPILRKLSKEVDWREIEINYMEDVILKGLAIGFSKESAENKTEALSSLLPYLSSWDQCDIIQSAFKVNELLLLHFTSLLERDLYKKDRHSMAYEPEKETGLGEGTKAHCRKRQWR